MQKIRKEAASQPFIEPIRQVMQRIPASDALFEQMAALTLGYQNAF